MDKEKIVRDLVNTFNDRDQLHAAYKKRMKGIFFDFFCCITENFEDQPEENINIQMIKSFINQYVEQRFKPQD